MRKQSQRCRVSHVEEDSHNQGTSLAPLKLTRTSTPVKPHNETRTLDALRDLSHLFGSML